MPAREPLHVHCRRLLDAQLAQAEALLRLLEEEGTVLAGNDPEPLEVLTRRKIDLALQIERLEEERRALARDAGLDPQAPQAFAAWLASQEDAAGLTRRWEALRTTLGACRDRNLRNGHTLRLQRIRTEAALQILQGEQAPATYTARGTNSPTGGRSGHDLGRA